MPVLLRFVFGLLVIGSVSLIGLWIWQGMMPQPPTEPEQVSAIPERPHGPVIEALLVQEDAARSGKRLLACDGNQCQTKPLPHEAPPEAVSDGESWYYYKDDSLVRQWLEKNETDVIVGPTELVRPRGLAISPNSQRIAYWLDNIDDEESELTELWMYDSQEGGTKVLVEKLVQPDVRTRPRWNRSSNHMWFIANSAEEEEEERLEFIVVGVQPVTVNARFADLNVEEIQEIADGGVMDVSFDGTSVAFAETAGSGKSRLVVVRENQPKQSSTVQGAVSYIQWLENGDLLYAVQDNRGFTFWQQQAVVHRFVARQEGQLRAALSDVRGEYLAFITEQDGRNKLAALQIGSGFIVDQGGVPSFGDRLYLVQVEGRQASQAPAVAGVTQFDDSQITAFVEKNIADITGIEGVRAHRIVFSEEQGAVYVDYRELKGEEQRILLVVHEIINPDWSIKARYRPAGGEWQKVQGGGLPDPKPARVYEWEESVGLWILKGSF